MAEALPQILVLDEVGSTNDVARERAATGAPHGWAVRARSQTAGRGQRGHSWTSPEGGLYLSVVVRPRLPQAQLQGLPLVAGVGACRALRTLGAAGALIKWPNDLVVIGCDGTGLPRKLGGILAEAGRAGTEPFAVVGIGINRMTPKVEGGTPHALDPIGLTECLDGGALPSPDELAAAVRDGIVGAVDEWAATAGRADRQTGAAAHGTTRGTGGTSDNGAGGGSYGVEDGLAYGTPGDADAAAGHARTTLGRMRDEYCGLLALVGERVSLISREGEPVGAGTLRGIDGWGRAIVDGRPYDASEASIRPALR